MVTVEGAMLNKILQEIEVCLCWRGGGGIFKNGKDVS
jgi:hypothetical protein